MWFICVVVLVWRACWLAGWYYSHLALPPFPWSVYRVHLMLSLPGWACWYYSHNLDITPFLWSACRVHLMSSLPGWACLYYSPNLDIPPFLWSACRVHLMLSLLGLPNSIQQFKCHTTLHMLSVLCVVLVYNLLGKLLMVVIIVSTT